MLMVVLAYANITNLPLSFSVLFSFLLAMAFVPFYLNFVQKTLASRIFLISVAYIGVLVVVILFGLAFNFQYFLVAFLGFPLIFFGNELGKKKIFLPIVAIALYIYLEWHLNIFEPFIAVSLPYTNIIRLANDFMILLLIFFQFYFFVKENESYTEDIIEKSNELADLNEPLRTVDSFVDIIREEYEDQEDENLNTYFTFITDALNRMRLMIDGMLKYSRIGKSSDPKMVDMTSLISEIKTDLGELIKQNNATIRINNLTSINCIPQETRQLFQNLISNAIKFQQPGSAPIINITQKEFTGYWQFCVADNGIGISPKKHKAIFQIFTKLQGIGLAFCKKIVEIHKGKIWVESSPGEGSRFYFTIQKNLEV